MFATQLDVVARMISGMPSDLAWRHRVRREVKVSPSMKQRRLGANLDNFAHELVSEDISGFHRWYVTIVKV